MNQNLFLIAMAIAIVGVLGMLSDTVAQNVNNFFLTVEDNEIGVEGLESLEFELKWDDGIESGIFEMDFANQFFWENGDGEYQLDVEQVEEIAVADVVWWRFRIQDADINAVDPANIDPMPNKIPSQNSDYADVQDLR